MPLTKYAYSYEAIPCCNWINSGMIREKAVMWCRLLWSQLSNGYKARCNMGNLWHPSNIQIAVYLKSLHSHLIDFSRKKDFLFCPFLFPVILHPELQSPQNIPLWSLKYTFHIRRSFRRFYTDMVFLLIYRTVFKVPSFLKIYKVTLLWLS